MTLHDRPALLTICRVDPTAQFTGVTFALPHLVSGRGAGATVAPAAEQRRTEVLHASASVVREAIDSLQQVRGFA